MRPLAVAIGMLLGSACGALAGTPRALWENRPVRAPVVTPVISGDTLWLAGSDRRIACLDLATGEKHWRRTLPVTASVSPVPVGPRILVGMGDMEPSLVALDRRNGHGLWTKRLRTTPIAVMVRGERAIVAEADGRIQSFRITDGEPGWQWEAGFQLAGAAMGDSALCVLARRDSLWLLSPETGRLRARRATNGVMVGSPAPAGRRFVFVRYDGTLFSVEDGGEAAVDSARGNAPQIARPLVERDRVVTVATGGEIACYRLPDLVEEWERPTGETVSTGAIAWNGFWIVLSEKGRVLGLTQDRGQTAWSLQLASPASTQAAHSDLYLAIIDNRGRVVVHTIDESP